MVALLPCTACMPETANESTKHSANVFTISNVLRLPAIFLDQTRARRWSGAAACSASIHGLRALDWLAKRFRIPTAVLSLWPLVQIFKLSSPSCSSRKRREQRAENEGRPPTPAAVETCEPLVSVPEYQVRRLHSAWVRLSSPSS